MKRSPSLPAIDRIIFPLDFDSLVQATPYITALKNHVGLFKVGLPLFIQEGREVFEQIHKIAGNKIFADLKFHDIPRTVGHAVKILRSVTEGVKFLTVHTCDGEAMIRAAVAEVGPRTAVLGVTVLTSVAGGSAPMTKRVMELARMAQQAGCRGVVCSGHEVEATKNACGLDFTVVTPGIRPAWAAVAGDDQQRTVTPGEAISRGADYVVVGRPIYTAKQPVEAAEQIAQEIDEALERRQRPS